MEHLKSFPILELPIVNPLINAYLGEKDEIRPFFNLLPLKSNVEEQIKQRKDFYINRALLVAVLKEQYANTQTSLLTNENILSLLSENTFTVTAGHQLCLLGGPNYLIIKICSVIATCKKLKAENPTYKFVPVFWLASEDHDFEEVSTINLFGRKLKWNTQQGGALGRYKKNNFDKIFSELTDYFSNNSEIVKIIEDYKQFFSPEETYSQSFKKWINYLFGEHGLIIIDADSQKLKDSFCSIILKELTESSASLKVADAGKKLKDLGYIEQLKFDGTALFYLSENGRTKIVKNESHFQIGDKKYSEQELLELVSKEPENFSPNAALRPLYQEYILPNIAFIGGGGELSYWLQLKELFELHKISFPMLCLRDSVFIIDSANYTRFKSFNYSWNDLFKSLELLKKEYLSTVEFEEISLVNEIDNLKTILLNIKSKVENIDKSLIASVEAEEKRITTALTTIENKLNKVNKAKFEKELNQIKKLKEFLFPQNNLQERFINHLNLIEGNNISELISTLIDSCNALEPKVHFLKT